MEFALWESNRVDKTHTPVLRGAPCHRRNRTEAHPYINRQQGARASCKYRQGNRHTVQLTGRSVFEFKFTYVRVDVSVTKVQQFRFASSQMRALPSHSVAKKSNESPSRLNNFPNWNWTKEIELNVPLAELTTEETFRNCTRLGNMPPRRPLPNLRPQPSRSSCGSDWIETLPLCTTAMCDDI